MREQLQEVGMLIDMLEENGRCGLVSCFLETFDKKIARIHVITSTEDRSFKTVDRFKEWVDIKTHRTNPVLFRKFTPIDIDAPTFLGGTA
jgi:hypothetical protein